MTQSNASLKTLTLIFAGLYLLISVAVFLLLVALEMFFQFSFDSSAMGVVIPTLSAMQVGTMYFNRTGQRPQRGFAWKAGFSFALTSTLLGVAVFIAVYLLGLFPELDEMLREPASVAILAGILVVVSLLLSVLCRFSFGFGARQAQKVKEKMQARG
ncbi:ABZJ_00895 family protein [Paracoccus onubensis]|uniref:Uncharacterized protein n=1 Tax=Paracoccus onubensis TaxID=1675788 RepID=A0A418SU60_9RHOB|nr:ABZJ_00895 family protein [Paracoccus onubensis]RJE84514.1 hypothetical protein D3P04_12760 [Paracoccus onubensis]